MFLDDVPGDELDLLRVLEESIKERLQELTTVGATRVEAHPPQVYDGKPVPKGILQVAYVSSAWGRPRSSNDAVQAEELQFQLSWELRDLQTHQSCYRLLRATVWLLKNYRPIECYESVFYPLAAALVEQNDQGFWTYNMMFGYQLPLI